MRLVCIGWLGHKKGDMVLYTCLFRKNVFISVISFQHVSPSPLFGL